jgi:hypothetical protein
MVYTFVIEVHDSSHVPEGISVNKKNTFRFNPPKMFYVQMPLL